METNPYATTVHSASHAFEPDTHNYIFKSTRILSYWVIGLLAVVGLFSSVIGVADMTGHVMVPGFASDETPLEGLGLALVGVIILSVLVLLPAMLACITMYCIWMYRSNANARALGATGMQYTPGWCVGYWFIPFLNLVRPYQATKEILQASVGDQPGSLGSQSWKSNVVPSFVGAWWFCWIVSNILERLKSRAESFPNGLGSATIPVGVASVLLTIAAATFAIMVVREITKTQERRSASVL